jgi:Dna[CI] antecedent, DciA
VSKLLHLSKSIRRTPKGYDGSALTTHRFCDLLPNVLSQISEAYHDRPDLVLASWPNIIGQKLAPMTEAISFVDGVLTVKVKNSTLHSLLNQNDKPRILNVLRQSFPNVQIKNIVFRIS